MEHRFRALICEPVAACSSISERVQHNLVTMVRRFGLTTNGVKHDAPLVLMVAQTCCASCRELDRCQCFLEGAANAELSMTITAAGRPRHSRGSRRQALVEDR